MHNCYRFVKNREMMEILRSLSLRKRYERWLTNMFLRSTDLWSSTLTAAVNGVPVPFPKEVVAAKMLWGVEAVVAYIEPIVFGRAGDDHRILLSFRERMRLYIHQFILGESWISDVKGFQP